MTREVNLAQSIFTTIATFLASALAGFLLFRKRPTGELPKVGANLRIRAATGMYRSKLVAIEESGWRLTAPLSRNNYVPLRVGDNLTIEAPVEHGVYLFRTKLLGRDAETHEMIIEVPENISPVNRREEARISTPREIMIDGMPGHIVNLSPLGARVRTNMSVGRGDRVRLDMERGTVFAWVLDVWPTKLGDTYSDEVRLRFDDIIDLRIA